MLIDNTLTFSEEVSPNDFVIADDDFSAFDNAWDEAKIMNSTRTERKSIVETSKLSHDALLKEHPDKADIINKYDVYDAPIGEGMDNTITGGFVSTVGGNPITARLERQRFKRYFDNGQIYMDESGNIQSNSADIEGTVRDNQDSLKQYWEYRQLTDGTQYDSATLEQRNVARMQDELIRLRQEGRGGRGFLSGVASLGGEMAFIATEPESIATMVGGVGNVGKGVVLNATQAFAKEAGLSLVTDAIMMPKIMQWRRKLYDPARGIEAYSTLDAVSESFVNALFAGGLQATGSLTVDAITKYKYKGVTKSGASKFSVVDKYRKRQITGYKWGSEEWNKNLHDDIETTLASRTEHGEADMPELVDELVEVVTSSPRGNIARHVDDISTSQEHFENETTFTDNTLHVEVGVAQTGDFVAMRQPSGETIIARVVDGDDSDIMVDIGDDSFLTINRASNEVDGDGWETVGELETINTGGHVEDVNQVNVRETLDADSVEQQLIKAHSEDEVIIRYTKGEQETLQKLVDEGCLTIDQMKVGA